MRILVVNIRWVVKVSVFPEAVIREFVKEDKFDFICISARSAGTLERILGINTGKLINHSDVPVIAVPHQYKAKSA